MAEPIDIDSLPDGPRTVAPSPVAQPSPQPGGVIDIDSLPDAPRTPTWLEAVGRALGSGFTFGGDDEIAALATTGGGLYGDYAKTRDAIAQHHKRTKAAYPVTDVLGQLAGGVAGSLYIPNWLVKGGSLAARGAPVAGRALTAAGESLSPAALMKSQKIGEFALESGKLGSKWGALAGLLEADPSPDSSVAGALVQRGSEAAKGGLVGGALAGLLGLPIGAAGRLAPYARETYMGYRHPELRGSHALIDDLHKSGGISVDDLIKQAIPRVEGGNAFAPDKAERIVTALFEDLRAGKAPGQGLYNDVAARLTAAGDKVTPKTVAAYHARMQENPTWGMTLPERARYKAAGDDWPDAATRPKTELDNILRATTRFTGDARTDVGKKLLRRQIDQDDRVGGEIKSFFFRSRGEGRKKAIDSFDDYVEKVVADRQRLAGKFYKRIDESDVKVGFDVWGRFAAKYAGDPLLEGALDSALRAAKLSKVWEGADAPLSGQAANIMQKTMRRAADAAWKRGEPMAPFLSKMHQEFLDEVADAGLVGFKELRRWYAQRMAREEALDLGRKLSLNTADGGKAMKLFRDWTERLDKATKAHEAAKKTGTTGKPLAELARERRAAQEVVDDLRRAQGQAALDAVGRKGKDTHDLGAVFGSRIARERITELLGKKDAEKFLAAMRRESEGTSTLQYVFGNSHTADIMEQFKKMGEVVDAGAEAMSGRVDRLLYRLLQMLGRAKSERTAGHQARLLSETDPAKVWQTLLELRTTQGSRQGWNPASMRWIGIPPYGLPVPPQWSKVIPQGGHFVAPFAHDRVDAARPEESRR